MSDDFDGLVAALDPALIVVTTAVDGEQAGCLVGFHSQSSISPQRYCVWLSKANHTYRVALRSTHLAVHFLTGDDLALAEHFGGLTGDRTDKFADLPSDPGPGGIPLLRAVPHRLIVRHGALFDEGGDHVCLPTEVLHASGSGTFQPLRLSQAGHIVPGHANDERNGV